MYIKFCRSYDADKKSSDEAKAKLSPESKLSVELNEEKDRETRGGLHVWHAICVLLGIICLVLLVVVVILSLKLQDQCPVGGDSVTSVSLPEQASMPAQVCSFEKCQTRFPQFPTQCPSCVKCDEGWLAFDNSCFYLSKHKLSWEESKSNCKARGGNLAVISNQGVQNFLSDKGSVMYWIGMRSRGGMWTWVNNTPVRKSYWAEDISSGDCGILRGEEPPEKNWVKDRCTSLTYFICEKQP
ncbi:killer cell lectin-like receptor subfamily B member 1B allele C isoform 2-T2 [Polymixia lowei]